MMVDFSVNILSILLILLGNVKADIEIQHTFFGTVPGFYDVSLNNFKSATGPQTKWIYKFVARTGGYKLSMHFFTKLEGNVDIKLYDGPDSNAPLIDISSIANHPIFSNEFFPAQHVTASGGQMYIEITALQPSGNNVTQDFQAIVTDHQNKVSDGCSAFGDVVLVCTRGSAETVNKFTYAMEGTNCINVFRSVDLSNSPLQTSFLQFPNGSDGVKVYKGLEISNDNQLLTNVRPFPVTDRNIIITRTAPLAIEYYWEHLKSAVSLKDFDYNQIGSIMTRDYISYIPAFQQTRMEQSFDWYLASVRNYPPGTQFTIELSILKKLGSSQLIITTIDSDGFLKDTINVTDSADGSLPVTFPVTGARIFMSYTNDKIPYTNGLYATYELKNILGTQVTQASPTSSRAPAVSTRASAGSTKASISSGHATSGTSQSQKASSRPSSAPPTSTNSTTTHPGKDKASSSLTPIYMFILLFVKLLA